MPTAWMPPPTLRTLLILVVILAAATVLTLTFWSGRSGDIRGEELSGDDIIDQLEKGETYFLQPPLRVRSTATIARLLRHDDLRVQAAALDMLHALGPAAADALPAVIAAVGSGDRFIRLRAISILPSLGDAAMQAVPVLLDTLLDVDTEIRVRAAEALGGLKLSDPGTLEIIGRALEDAAPSVRLAAARALAAIHARVGISGELLARMLVHRDPEVRLQAAMAIAERAPEQAGALVPGLIEMLSDPQAALRWSAAEALVNTASAAVPFASEVLNRSDPVLQRLALHILGRVPEVPDDTFFTVVSLLQAPEPSVRQDALATLAPWSNRAETARVYVVEALDDPESKVRRQALKTLQALTVDPASLVEHAASALADPAPEVADAALELLTVTETVRNAALPWILQLIGQVRTTKGVEKFFRAIGEPAIKHLTQLLEEGTSAQRSAIISILGDPVFPVEQVIAILQNALKDDDPAVRMTVVSGLGNLASKNKRALTVLSKAVRDGDPEVRRTAVSSLGRLAQWNPAAVSALVEALGDNPEMVGSALFWLHRVKRWKNQADALVEPLQALLRDDDPEVRRKAAEILRRIGAVPERSVAPGSEIRPTIAQAGEEKLAQAMADGRLHLIRKALGDLVDGGKPIPEAVPHLERLLEHDNISIRREVAKVLVVLYGRTQGLGTVLFEDLTDQKLIPTAKDSYLLGKLGLQAHPAVPALLRVLEKGQLKVQRVHQRKEALWTLLHLGADVIPLLRDELRNTAQGHPVAAAFVLGQIGPAAKAAVPDLILLAQNPDQPTVLRAEVIRALGRIGTDAAVPALTTILRENPAEAKRRAFGSFEDPDLRSSGERNPEMLAILADDPLWISKWIRRRDPKDLRYAACESLERIGPAASSAVPVLADLANGRSPSRMSAPVEVGAVTALLFTAIQDPAALMDRWAAKNIAGMKNHLPEALLALAATLLIMQFPWKRSNAPYLVRVFGPGLGISAALLVFAIKVDAVIVAGTLACIPAVLASIISNLSRCPPWLERTWQVLLLIAGTVVITLVWKLDPWSLQLILAVAVSTAMVLIWASSSVLVRHAPGSWQWPAWIAVTMGLTVALLQTGSPPPLVLFALGVVLLLGCIWLVALLIPWHGWEQSMLDIMVLLWFSAIVLSGVLVNLPLVPVMLIAAAPLAGWIGDIPTLRQLPALPRQLLRVVAIAGVTLTLVWIGPFGPVTPALSIIKEPLRAKALDTLVAVGASPEALILVAEKALTLRITPGAGMPGAIELAEAAARAMASAGADGRDSLIRMLEDAWGSKKITIAHALAELDTHTEVAITTLHRANRESDYPWGGSSLLALAALDPSPETLTRLLEWFDDQRIPRRTESELIPWIDALKHFTQDTGRVLPVLEKILVRQLEDASIVAAKVVGEFGPEAAHLGRKLIALPTPKQPLRRYTIIKALGRLGPGAGYAAPFLTDVLTADDDPVVRAAAAWSLGSIETNDTAAIKALNAAASNRGFAYSPEVRVAAQQALERLNQFSGNNQERDR